MCVVCVCVPPIPDSYLLIIIIFLAHTSSMTLFAYSFWQEIMNWRAEQSKENTHSKEIQNNNNIFDTSHTYTILVRINLGISNLRFHLLRSWVIVLIGRSGHWKYGARWCLALVMFAGTPVIVWWLFWGRSMAVGHLKYGNKLCNCMRSCVQLK